MEPSVLLKQSAESLFERARKPMQRLRDSVKLEREVRASGLKLQATAVEDKIGMGQNRKTMSRKGGVRSSGLKAASDRCW